jgi:hypothetical protein
MADQIAKVDYYMGTIPNKVGEGFKVLSALKEAGLSLTGFLAYAKGRKTELIVVVPEKTPKVGAAIKKGGVEAGDKGKGFLVYAADVPGALAEIAGKLAEAKINLVSCHAVAAGEGRFGALVVVDGADNRKAAKILGV